MFTARFGRTLLNIELRSKPLASGAKAPFTRRVDGGAEASPFQVCVRDAKTKSTAARLDEAEPAAASSKQRQRRPAKAGRYNAKT